MTLNLIAIIIAFCSLVVVFLKMRILSRDLKTKNYQSLLDRIGSNRNTIINNPKIGEIFKDNSELGGLMDKTGLTPEEFFWLLNYLTTWENFYYQRQKGVMADRTWVAYLATINLIFQTPKIRDFWIEFRQLGTYRKDWVNFVNSAIRGEQIEDPILPLWKRMLM